MNLKAQIKCLLVSIGILSFAGRAIAANSPFLAIEIISEKGHVISGKGAREVQRESAGYLSLYKWNNHLLLFGIAHDIKNLQKRLITLYPGFEIKTYKDPFYVFDKKERCSDKNMAKEWTNIILTANLVADPKKQQEYLNYHKTQFEKWPEVSNGFCNANFQQLLVFKNGRRLMLVISIPKGKTLDELNPLTTKNNPRVDEWNKIMSQYQEGIQGTKKGETWVFFKPLAESGSPKYGKTESLKHK